MSALPFVALVVIGASWGATQPLSKIAVSEGYEPLGILVWQTALIGLALGAVTLLRGRRIPFDPGALRIYAIIAAIGSVLPGITSYSAAVHLPSGVLSILLSSVPMLAFPVALALGLERFRARRLLGLALGLSGVLMLILPENGLPGDVAPFWVGVALLSSCLYAMEGNYVARWGLRGMDAFQVLTGASIVGLVACLPLALLSGQAFWSQATGAPDLAILASSLIHAVAYAGYIWLVGLAGSVFAVQVSCLVTLFGVAWAMLFLGENYSGWFWAALATMLGGMALVQPRPRALVSGARVGQDVPG